MNETTYLTELLKDLHNTTGFRISIHDINFKEIAGYPPEGSLFCRMIHKSDKIYSMCLAEDRERFLEAKENQKTIIYKCQFGLYEAISPIYNYNTLSGYLIMGQIAKKDDFYAMEIYDSVKPYLNNDSEELLRIIKTIPVIDEKIINSSINLMTVCASYLTLTNKVKTGANDLGELIFRYLYNNYPEKITFESMCNKFHCCKSTLINAFKRTYNTTIMQKLTEIRIDESKKLLKESDISISEISLVVGFSDQSYFSKIFKEYCGMTPREYRNNPPV